MSSAVAPWAVAGLGALVAYALGLGLDLMEVDAAQYAAISRDMAETGRWLELTDRGEAFLNKPPLLFWLSALSLRIFGVSDVAYRIPSTLAFVLGVFSVYKLAVHYAGERAGRWSALTLATCQGAFLMNHDVRTDTMLLGFVAFALWQAARFLDRPRPSTAVWLGLGLGAALLTKGLIGLAVPLLGIGAHLAGRRAWRDALRREWLLVIAVAALLLVPMAIGLYRQHGFEGLRFHLWTQGLGRVFDENIWGDAHGPFFFIPQAMWTFLPWTLFLGAALWSRVRRLGRSGWRLHGREEALTLGSFALGFIALSLSRSKLPHYVYVTLPAAAVMTGTWVAGRLDRAEGSAWPRGLVASQRLTVVIMWAVVGTLVGWAFPLRSLALAAALAGLALLALLGVARTARGHPTRVLAASLLTIVAANLALNGHVYPQLFAYQATGAAGRLIAERDPSPEAIVTFRRGGHALDFYARRTAVFSDELEGLRDAIARDGAGDVWGYADDATWARIRASDISAQSVATYRSFPISKLTGRFLDPDTRASATTGGVLFRIPAAAPIQ